MKSVKEVEKTRREYHRDASLNSVHRSSTTVPEIDGYVAEVTFLNHFMIKHGYGNIGCRVTAIDHDGKRIESRLHQITEPKVYRITLTGMVDAKVDNYLIEFFSPENLFFAYPAVMVNHKRAGAWNMVHGYNRVLNDVFDEDAVNAHQVAEASFDVVLEEGMDTFLIFTAGPAGCDEPVVIEFVNENRNVSRELPMNVARLTNTRLSMRSIFPELEDGETGVVKVRQPNQFLFWGRMMVGKINQNGIMSANHSYYDNSDYGEYWDNDLESRRMYPVFAGMRNGIRIYPVTSPGTISIQFDLYDEMGSLIASSEPREMASPGPSHVDFRIDSVVSGSDLERVASCNVRAAGIGGNTPTRIPIQQIYSSAEASGPEVSIQEALASPNIFVPETKKGLIWGQIPVAEDHDSRIAVVGSDPAGPSVPVSFDFYDAGGLFHTMVRELPGGGAIHLNGDDIIAHQADRDNETDGQYIWYVARSDRADIRGTVVSRNLATGQCTGEHNF